MEEHKYKQHPQVDLLTMNLPDSILKVYDVDEYGLFIYMKIEGFGEIPIFWGAYNSYLKHKKKLKLTKEPDFSYYAKGFIRGYNEEFAPYIDTNENRKELILKELLKSPTYFTMTVDLERKSHYYDNELLEKHGENTGRCYKAWEIVLKNPNYFKNDFDLFVNKSNGEIISESEEILRDNNSKNKPIYNEKIFTSFKGFQLFEAFQGEIPFRNNPSTEYADYSFLFEKLKADEFIHEMKHQKFINFLSKEYKVEFAQKYKQLKYSETKIKKDTYKRLKAHFQ